MFDALGTTADLALKRALDGSVARHRAIAENMANVDTPGYKRLEVEFQSALRAALGGSENGGALARTNPRHLSGGQASLDEALPLVQRVTDTSARADGNNVDLDTEMTKLAENSLLYDSLTQVLGRRLAMMRFAISEGRR